MCYQIPQVCHQKPTITAANAEDFRQELKRFKVAMNEARAHQKSRWFRAARAVCKDRARQTLETFITTEFGNKDTFMQTLGRPFRC